MITQNQLIDDLIEIGLKRGDAVCVHSSLKSIGKVQNRSDTVIDALLYVIGKEGTLLMPTFSYCFEGREGVQAFDLENTPSETGLITEIFRKRPGTLRSNCPTHSVAANGKRASEFIEGHETTSALGVQSPFHKFSLAEGKVLFIGVDFRACSLIHVAEALCNLSYLNKFCWYDRGWTGRALIRTPSGNIEAIEQKQVPGCGKNFHKLQPVMDKTECITNADIGDACSMLCSGQDIIDAVQKACKDDPYFLLCESDCCRFCKIRRS